MEDNELYFEQLETNKWRVYLGKETDNKDKLIVYDQFLQMLNSTIYKKDDEELRIKMFKLSCDDKFLKIRHFTTFAKKWLLEQISQYDIADHSQESIIFLIKHLETLSQQYMNNERFGQTVEYVICMLSNISCHMDKKRLLSYVYNCDKLRYLIQDLLKKIPKIKEHIGTDNMSMDFILNNKETLSVKSNFSTSKKVCPQNIGQPTEQRFLECFKESGYQIKSDISQKQNIKNMILSNPGYFLDKYLYNTFCCDYILWVSWNRKYNTYTGKVIGKKDIGTKFKFDNNKITFTHTAESWNESATVKYNGISIGEFQIHKHRNCVKFRFCFDKVLQIISD